jgi:hypothetical protein
MIGKLLYYFTHNQDYRRDNLGTIKVRYLLIAVNLFLVLYFKRTVAPPFISPLPPMANPFLSGLILDILLKKINHYLKFQIFNLSDILTNHDDLSVPYEANSSEKRMFDT